MKIFNLHMSFSLDPIRNKQRILITGNHGIHKITSIIFHVLKSAGKPFDFIDGDQSSISEAPIVFLKGGDQLVDRKPAFLQYEPHVLLIHKITDDKPDGYKSFEEYVAAYEQLADGLPKSGIFIYYEGDPVSTIIGKKEREDVKAIEYTSLDSKEFKSSDKTFLLHAAAAKALLKRIGISEKQFAKGISTL